MISFRDILCKIGIHDWISSDDYNSQRSRNAKVCKNCYLKIYKRKFYDMKRKNGASRRDIRNIKILKLIEKRDIRNIIKRKNQD